MKGPKTGVFFAMLVGVAALLLYATLTTGHDWGDDFSAYIMQARSITEGAPRQFIEANRFTVEQSYAILGPVVYPWGFPVMLAPVYRLFGLNMLALKAVSGVCLLLFLLVLWPGFRKRHSPLWFLCLVGLFALNPLLLGFTNHVLSDIPFMLFSTLAIVLMGIVIVEDRTLISRVLDNIVLGAAIAACFCMRTNGIVLPATLAITQAVTLVQHLRRERRAQAPSRRAVSPAVARDLAIDAIPYVCFFAIVLACEMLLPKGWQSQHVSHSGNMSLAQSITLASVTENLGYYFNLPPDFLAGVPYGYALWIASIPLAVTGAIRRFRQDYHIVAYGLLTLLLCILWPGTQGIRYLFPIIPFYCSFLLSGAEALQGRGSAVWRASGKLACLLPTLFVLVFFAMDSTSNAYGNLVRHREAPCGPFTPASAQMFSFVGQHTERTATVIFFKPRAMRMLTNRGPHDERYEGPPARRLSVPLHRDQDDRPGAYRRNRPARGAESGAAGLREQ
jgi:hypothetical protein